MVNAMTSYAEDRARYDTTYIRGVYASVEAASSQFKISTNATWPGVATALRDIRACLSIDANTIDGNPVVEGDFRAHVRADLKRRRRAWLCVGRLKVIGAVLVHAAWVAPLVRLRRDLAYAPH